MISSDNTKLDTDSSIISTQSLREQASKWNLGNDVSLLQHLQGVSSKILGEISSLQKDLKSLSKEALSTAVKVDNVAQTFNLLSSNQYMESRVYDDDDEQTSSKVPAHQIKPVMSREEKEEAMIPKIRQVLLIGMDILKPSQSPVEQNNKQHFAKNLEYDARSLPYLIGSAEFLQHPTAGLATSYQEKDQKEERMKESKRVIDEQTVQDGLSVSVSTSLSIDSDDDTHKPQVAAVPSVTEEIARILKPGFERVKSSSLFEEPSLTSPSLAHEIGRQESAKGSLCEDDEDLLISEEVKRSTALPLFNENEDTDTDEDLFHPKTTARKTPVVANGKKPSGGVSMLGAANPSILIHSKQPEDQSVPPPSPKSKANSSVIASQPSKPAFKPLFEDDEEDLFAPHPALGQLPKPLPRIAPPSAPSVTERQVDHVKPAASTSALVQSVKKQTLFGDSDSEDDLFAPIKPVAVLRQTKPRETENPHTAKGNSKTPAVAPRTQVENISNEIQPAASLRSEAVFEDDEDDLFSTKSDMPKSSKLRVKSALSSAITPTAVQPIFESQESTSAPRSTRPRSRSPPSDKVASVLSKNFNSPAISIQKPVLPSNLFEDSDDDLFAQVTSRKPTLTPKVSPAVIPTTPKPEKNGERLQVKQIKNLFESDDEDDLFAQASLKKSQQNTRASEAPAISEGTTPVPEVVTNVIPPTPSSPDVTNLNSKLTDDDVVASSVLDNSGGVFPSQSDTFGVALPSSEEREDIGGSLTEIKPEDYPYVSSNTKKLRTPLSGLEVSPIASPRESGSDVSDVERPSRKPVGGVALFSGALLLDARLKSRQNSRESPVSVSPLASGDSWPVFSPSPVPNGTSFEGPSALDGPSSKLLPTVIKARAKIVVKRKPPSKRFREQGLQHQQDTTDQRGEYVGNEMALGNELPKATEAIETAIPEADVGNKMESLFEFSDEENLSFKPQEKDIAIVSEKLDYEVSSTVPVSREDELKNEACTVDSMEKNAKMTNLPVGDIPAHDGELKTDQVQITDVIKPAMTPSSAKVATLFDSDEDDDLFAPKPISPQSVPSSKPIIQAAELGALPSSLHEESRGQSIVLESNRITDASVLFHGENDTSEDDLFAASSAFGKRTETSQTTPQESQESRETSKQIVRELKAKATKPKLSATFFEDDSDEDLFSSKSSKGKFASVSKTTTPFSAPKKGSAPFKDPLLGSP